MIDILTAIAAAYIVTVVITGASLLEPARRMLREKIPGLQITPKHPHFIDCRLCVGFWVSGAATLAMDLPWQSVFLIYGTSYFLATQER